MKTSLLRQHAHLAPQPLASALPSAGAGSHSSQSWVMLYSTNRCRKRLGRIEPLVALFFSF